MATVRFPTSKLRAAIWRGARDGLDKVSAMYQRALYLQLSTPGTGLTFGRYRRSAPGDSPAVQTGSLRRSWQRSKVYVFGSMAMVKIGSPLKYARYLEFGTRNMIARPYIKPVRKRVDPVANAILNKAMSQSLTAAGFGSKA